MKNPRFLRIVKKEEKVPGGAKPCELQENLSVFLTFFFGYLYSVLFDENFFDCRNILIVQDLKCYDNKDHSYVEICP
jgi:hypothetical protein